MPKTGDLYGVMRFGEWSNNEKTGLINRKGQVWRFPGLAMFLWVRYFAVRFISSRGSHGNDYGLCL